MSTRTIQVQPSGDIHHEVTEVDMEMNNLTLYGKNNQTIAHYRPIAWESWNVIPQLDDATPKQTQIEQLRDEKGRFIKRK